MEKWPEGALSKRSELDALLEKAKAEPVPIYVVVWIKDMVLLRLLTENSFFEPGRYRLEYVDRERHSHSVIVAFDGSTREKGVIFTNYWLAYAEALRRKAKETIR